MPDTSNTSQNVKVADASLTAVYESLQLSPLAQAGDALVADEAISDGVYERLTLEQKMRIGDRRATRMEQKAGNNPIMKMEAVNARRTMSLARTLIAGAFGASVIKGVLLAASGVGANSVGELTTAMMGVLIDAGTPGLTDIADLRLGLSLLRNVAQPGIY